MNLQAQPLVSVVTPVYNGEKYLAECIESVLTQTYANWEYIIVNNYSTDRSLTIAHSYAQQDARIRIHNNQEFVGVIQNHNIAFRQISVESKYCKVVHADDLLFPECIMQMVKVAEANPSVGIVGSYGLSDVQVLWDGLPYPRTVVSGPEICRQSLLGGPYVFGSPTSLLIRSDHVRNRKAFYNEAHIHADTESCYDVLQTSDFGFVHQILFYNRRHSESVSSSFSERVNSVAVGTLMILKKYGPIYLTPAEHGQCLKQKMDNYYRYLGKSVFQMQDKQFWEFHRNSLKNLGYPLSSIKLFKGFIFEGVDVLLCPVETLRNSITLVWKRKKQQTFKNAF